MISTRSFDELVVAATGHSPYPYQRRLADEGLPEVLRAATGSGKTVAAVLPWLFRRRFHPDGAVRASTPMRLVIVLPQRSLVEQTARVTGEWLANLGLADHVQRHVLMGGLDQRDREWQLDPAADAVFVGTQDMILSRLLMRGYAESRANWPISFGLLHCGTQFVFDEVQLMGPALPTSRQLQGLRDGPSGFGAAAPCASMWMSATVDLDALRTVDAPRVGSVIELSDADRQGALGRRLRATRRVDRLSLDVKKYPVELAAAVMEAHQPGTRTIVVLNTVRRAVELYDALVRSKQRPPIVLVHSRFRPCERAERFDEAAATPGDAGVIVIATQVLEAGVDIDSHVLVTETAPWSSIVQRAGRCNRSGEDEDARFLWVDPPGRDAALPYDQEDVAAASGALTALEGCAVSGEQLQNNAVEEKPKLYSVLRRRDLVDLFDTAPDLAGNDLDVSRWIRDADSFSCSVLWRDIPAGAKPDEMTPAPSREELCPVTVSDLRDWLRAGRGRAWLFDQTAAEWRRAQLSDVRPGVVMVLDSVAGGYDPLRGWSPGSKAAVTPVDVHEVIPAAGMSDDPDTACGKAVSLADHLDDVRGEVCSLFEDLGDLPGLTDEARKAAELAGFYHDLGKAHAVFAESLATAGVPPEGGPWAKSETKGRLRHRRPGFRHELASALMLLDPGSGLLDDATEPDLVSYLVAAHHGKVRMSVRSLPYETSDRILGVQNGDVTPSFTIHDDARGESVCVPELVLRREVLEVGASDLGESWQTRARRLRDRLGPFKLGFLEAVVRLADWRASASYDRRDERETS